MLISGIQIGWTILNSQSDYLFIKNGPIPASFVYFRHFHIAISIIKIEKSVHGVLWIWTHGRNDGGRRQYYGAWNYYEQSQYQFYLKIINRIAPKMIGHINIQPSF